MIRYGLISNVDAQTIEKTLYIIMNEFKDEFINTLEIGVYDGVTSRGINEYIKQQGRNNYHTCIDNHKDKEVLIPFHDCQFIVGNSNEVYNQIADNSQHFIFIDGNHSFPMVVSDFFCFESKVKYGGYIAFHDSGYHIHDFKDYQRMGDERDKDMYISVRKALHRIGLLDNQLMRWRKIFDEQDIDNPAGGIIVFRKIII